MAAKKEGGSARRKGSAGWGGGGGTVAKTAGPDAAVAGVDPWGSFFEKFWGPAEGEGVDPPEGGREPAKDTRKAGTKPGR
jgi:hypothetical protein